METMFQALKKILVFCFLILVLLIPISACSNQATPSASETPTKIAPTMTATSDEPTATLVPAAAVVNGERVPLAWFESELARYLMAQETLGNADINQADARAIVLEDVLDLTLLAQAAKDAGFLITDEEVQQKVDQMAEELDLTTWMSEWGYSEADLIHSLRLEMLAAHQRNIIADSVPEITEQVELRQVFAYTQEGAENALVSLDSGRDFTEVAFQYDPTSGGYLGWVPRGYLLIPAVEEAAFNLPVDGISDIIDSDIGFHILKVLDRGVRPLSPDARLILQRQALYVWLEEKRQVSTIEVLID